jgi:hypothetical protein
VLGAVATSDKPYRSACGTTTTPAAVVAYRAAAAAPTLVPPIGTRKQAMYLFVIRQTDDFDLRSDVILLFAVPLPSILLITLFRTEEPQP